MFDLYKLSWASIAGNYSKWFVHVAFDMVRNIFLLFVFMLLLRGFRQAIIWKGHVTAFRQFVAAKTLTVCERTVASNYVF